MDILILNSILPQDPYYYLADIAQEFYRNSSTIHVYEKKIYDCVSCSACAVKTPGICVFKDDMTEILTDIVNSDYLIFLTKISFGSYDSRLKKVIDRFLPLMVPKYVLRKGEMHHKNRYKMPYFIGIGATDSNNRFQTEIFHRLVQRNALNANFSGFQSFVIQDREVSKAKILFEKLGAVL